MNENIHIAINPPPISGCCECCGRHYTEVPEKKLHKDFRENGGCVSAYWECRLCIGFDDKLFWDMVNARKYFLLFADYLERIGKQDKELDIEDIYDYIEETRAAV